jgi:predicted enzyme related to lactoylglutathione lyase
MAERDGYIPGVPCWVDTNQPDPDAAAAFYGGLFGWQLEDMMPPDSPGKYFMARLRGGDVAAISSVPDGAPPRATWNTYVAVDDADSTAAKVKDAGGQVLAEPFDVFEAGRMAVFSDPEGAVFSGWQAGRHKGARVVNEHGSLNFNGLNTRDPERAKAFYSAAFGWGTMPMNAGSEAWTLSGYGDHLEQSDPGLRARLAEFGGPAGFEDVVASIMPIPEGHADMPAHWSVVFAVDDADEVARKATELGGKVLAEPFDAPWVRMTIIADPQGASFIGSQFAPQNKNLAEAA